MGNDVRVQVDGRVLMLSNLDKVLYPRTGTTKGEVLDYYARIAPRMLPYLRDRVVTRVRWPDGVQEQRFFEKNAPANLPSWIRVVELPEDGPEGGLRMPVVDDVAALTWMANMAALEFHVHQWRLGDDGGPSRSDRVVVDLDPGEPAGLHECCRVALLVRDRLAEFGAEPVPVLSGSKGVHLYVDLPEPLPAEEIATRAKAIANELTKARPDLVTATMAKERRRDKVFFDWSQNNAAKTTICPFSLRGRDRPTVAMPVGWGEVEAGAEDPFALDQMDFAEALRRHG